MFNQKLHHYLSDNPEYIITPEMTSALTPLYVHNCTNPYTSLTNSKGTASQTWTDKNVAVELFGMRPIVSSEEYLDSIKKYLTDIVLNDRLTLSNSNLINEEYIEFFDDGNEPMTSFISMINLDVTNKLNMVMLRRFTFHNLYYFFYKIKNEYVGVPRVSVSFLTKK